MTDPAARRLIIASALRLHAVRRLGDVLCSDADLTASARRLAEDTDHLETTYGLAFTPAYPGAGAGVEEVDSGRRRLVLACAAHDRHGPGAGTAFTTLIPGRAPQVSVAPATAPVPADWTWSSG